VPEILTPPTDPTYIPPVAVSVPPKNRFNLGLTLAHPRYVGSLTYCHSDKAFFTVVLDVTYYGYANACPANRYSGDRPVDGATEAGASWKILALDRRFDWIELANQGYSHAPDNDTNLNHHELSIRQRGCNLDHAGLGAPDYCRTRLCLARNAYRSLGIPDSRVPLVRFPGAEDSPEALLAALRRRAVSNSMFRPAKSSFLSVSEVSACTRALGWVTRPRSSG